MLTASLLVASLQVQAATADTCGDLAAKFADEDKRDGMTIGEMDDLRLCVGEWMRDQILQKNKTNKESANQEAGLSNQTAQATHP